MKVAVRFSAILLLLSAVFSTAIMADDWPGFRGAKGGASDETNLPVQLSKDNILWKVKIPGPGTSSPIIYRDRIYLTCYTGYGTTLTKGFGSGFGGFGKGKGGFGKGGFGKKKGGFGKGGFGKGGFGKGGDSGGDQKNLRLHLLCYDTKKGELVWQKEIEPKLPEFAFTGYMREHGYASHTPVTDGERIYAFFGKSGVIAFDMNGNKLWHKSVGSGTDKWGSAASPVLYKDLVIVNACVESGSLVALNKNTGEEVWRVKGMSVNWTSPLVAETKDGKHELVMNLQGKVVGYDPDTGKELWHCQGIGNSTGYGYTCSTPVARDGIVYVIGGGGPTARAASLAIKTGGRGDVTRTHVLWRKNAGTTISSPVLAGDYVCWVAGSLNCLRASDGKIVHQERLYNGFNEYVSAVSAGDKLYALTRFDGLFVLGVGEKLEKLDRFEFSDDDSFFNASPAISNGRLYVRSNNYLYCIGKKSEQ